MLPAARRASCRNATLHLLFGLLCRAAAVAAADTLGSAEEDTGYEGAVQRALDAERPFSLPPEVRYVDVSSANLGAEAYSGAAATGDGSVVFAPYNEDNIGIYSTATDSFTQLDISATLSADAKFRGAATITSGNDAGKIVFAGYDSNGTGIYDPDTQQFTIAAMFARLRGPGLFWGAAAHPNGKVYFAPFNFDNVAWYDPALPVAAIPDSTFFFGDPPTPQGKFSGVAVASDGRVVYAPYNWPTLGVYDPGAQTVETFAVPNPDTPGKYAGAAATYNGKVVFAPLNADHLGVFDANTNEFEPISLPVHNGDYGGAVATMNNAMVAFCFLRVGRIGIYDSATGRWTLTDVPGGSHLYAGGAAATPNTLIFAPWNSQDIGAVTIDTLAPTPVPTVFPTFMPAVYIGPSNGTLPDDHELELGLLGGRRLVKAAGDTIVLNAGEPILNMTFRIYNPPNTAVDYQFNATASAVVLVPATMSKSWARNGRCIFHDYVMIPRALGLDFTDLPLGGQGGVPFVDARGIKTIRSVSWANSTIRVGGRYRLCYSSDGTFAKDRADLIDVVLDVRGACVSSSCGATYGVGVTPVCQEDDCLAKREFTCYYRLGERGTPGRCSVPMEAVAGTPGKIAWSAKFLAYVGGNGRPWPVTSAYGEPVWNRPVSYLYHREYHNSVRVCGIGSPDPEAFWPANPHAGPMPWSAEVVGAAAELPRTVPARSGYFISEEYWACPVQSEQIMGELACQVAALMIGRSYMGNLTSRGATAGCINIVNGTSPGIYFNSHPVGSSRPGGWDVPVCSSVLAPIRYEMQFVSKGNGSFDNMTMVDLGYLSTLDEAQEACLSDAQCLYFTADQRDVQLGGGYRVVLLRESTRQMTVQFPPVLYPIPPEGSIPYTIQTWQKKETYSRVSSFWTVMDGLPEPGPYPINIEKTGALTVEGVKKVCEANSQCMGFGHWPLANWWYPVLVGTFNPSTATYTQRRQDEVWQFYYLNGRAEAVTVAICYCADGVCDSFQDFWQQIGVLYLYVAHSTFPSEPMCVTPNAGALAPVEFALCVRCPPGACPFNTPGSRVRILRTNLDEKPSWDSDNQCGTATESNPRVEPAAVLAAEADGGLRSDFKRFVPLTTQKTSEYADLLQKGLWLAVPGETRGFSAPSWPEVMVPGTDLDVCFCVGNCSVSSSWFKAGQLEIVHPQLLAAVGIPAAPGTELPFEVGRPGMIALDRSVLPYGRPTEILGLSAGGGIRLVDFNPTVENDTQEVCSRLGYRPRGWTEGAVDPNTVIRSTVDGSRLIFNNGSSEPFVFKQVLTGVVCYCANLNSDDYAHCLDPPWVPVGMVVVNGPNANQEWVLPTHRLVRFMYTGRDLRSTDRLRLVEQDASGMGPECDEQPESVQICGIETVSSDRSNRNFHKICGRANTNLFSDYSTQVLAWDSVNCDEFNENCGQAPLEWVEVNDHGTLELRFQVPPTNPSGFGELGLVDDDTVMIDDGVTGITCSNTACTPTTLAGARGVFGRVGLQAYYDFEDSSNPAEAKDRVSYGAGDAAIDGSPAWIGGYFGSGAMRFQADSDGMQFGFTLDAARPWSLVAWVKPHVISSFHTICGFSDGNGFLSTGEVEFGIATSPQHGAGKGVLYLEQSPGLDPDLVLARASNTVIEEGVWTHVAFVYGGAGGGDLFFYIDGNLAYKREEIRIVQHEAGGTPIRCGGGVGRQRVDVLDIDELRYYNLPLSSAEVTSLFAAPDPSMDVDLMASAAVGNRVAAAPSDRPNANRTFEVLGVAERWASGASYEKPVFRVNGGPPGGSGMQGHWRRTNKGYTRAEVMSPKQQRMRVCWTRPTKDGSSRFVDAGTIRFKDPAPFAGLGMWMTATEWQKSAPFVITFETSPAYTEVGRRYAQAEGTLHLEIVFLNTPSFNVMQSTLRNGQPGSGEIGMELPASPPGETTYGEASQVVCGKIFRELWSDDTNGGFPLPRGCFHRMISLSMREVIIVFEQRNGFRGGKKYQMVMNGRAEPSFSESEEAIMITTVDDYDNRRYTSLEIGHLYPNQGVQLGGGKNDPQFNPVDGIRLTNGDKTHLKKIPNYDDNGVSLKIWIKGPGWQTGRIKRGCHLKLWFLPLTSWNIPQACHDVKDPKVRSDGIRAECSVAIGKFRRCGQLQECKGQRVAADSPFRNAVELTFGESMNDLYGSLVYQLELWGFTGPALGAPPSQMLAELYLPEGTKPRFQRVDGAYIWSPTDIIESGEALGRLLMMGKDDTPFRGQSEYLVYMKLVLPTFLRGADNQREGAGLQRPQSEFHVQLPEGFTCLNISHAPPKGLGRQALTLEGDARAGLDYGVHDAPTGFGTPDARGWSVGDRFCNYTLPDLALIPARASIVVGVHTKPSNETLLIDNPDNLWQVNVITPGYHNVTRIEYGFKFYRTGSGGVPVTDIMTKAYIQPTDSTLSRPGSSVEQFLYVFVQLTQNVTSGGCVDVVAPQAFDFGEFCTADDLPSEDTYYARSNAVRVNKLPTINYCQGARTIIEDSADSPRPHNVARIWVVGEMWAGWRYGFRVKVRNPSEANVTDYPDGEWTIRTRSELLPIIENSQGAIPGLGGAAEMSGTWKLRRHSLTPRPMSEMLMPSSMGTVAIDVSPMLPFDVTGQVAIATVLFRLPADIQQAAFRIVASEGYHWSLNGFMQDPVDPWSEYVTANFTLDVNTSASAGNDLHFEAGDLMGGELYGFSMPIHVPDLGPSFSAQLVYVDISPRGQGRIDGYGGAIDSPKVCAITDGRVRLSNRLALSMADLLIEVKLATPVAHPGHLRLTIPENYTLESCELRPWPGIFAWEASSPFSNATCDWYNETRSIVIRPRPEAPLPAARLEWRMEVRNPNYTTVDREVPTIEECGTYLCWTFETFSTPSKALPNANGMCDIPYCGILDVPETVPGSDTLPEMHVAEIVNYKALRDDRPGQRNRLVFRFRFKSDEDMYKAWKAGDEYGPLPPGRLELIGPVGFQFESRCLPDLEYRVGNIFESAERAKARWKVDPWASSAKILGCQGDGRMMILSVAAGLRVGKHYAFSIYVTNPLLVPEDNNWTMTFLDHFSRPIPSFDIMTFSNMSVVPFSAHSGPTCYGGVCEGAGYHVAVPVNLTFRVISEITTEGEVQITLPPDFGFAPADRDVPLIPEEDVPSLCTVLQWWDGNMTVEPEVWRDTDQSCVIMSKGHPLVDGGTGDKRTLRIILKYVPNDKEEREPRSITPDSIYTAVVFVDPPPGFRLPGIWELHSYAPDKTLLDVGGVIGYRVDKVLWTLDHSNREYNFYTFKRQQVQTAGLAFVPDFVFDMSFQDNVWISDTIIITAPPGLYFEQQFPNGTFTGKCIQLELKEPKASLAPGVLDPVTCDRETMILPLRNFRRAVQARENMRIFMGITNPERPPPASKNYWKVQHLRGSDGEGALMAAAIVVSWEIVPQLYNFTSAITGIYTAAGAFTNLSFSFSNVQKASEVLIEAMEPPGMIFDQAFCSGINDGRFAKYFQILKVDGPLLRVVIRMAPYTRHTLDILGVVLPDIPEQTSWRFRTYELSAELEDYGTPYLRDEVYFGGFRVPGRFTVVEATAKTLVASMSGERIFSAAVLGRVRTTVTFTLDTSYDLAAGDVLVLWVRGSEETGFLFEEWGQLSLAESSPGFPLLPSSVIKEGLNPNRSRAMVLGSSVNASGPAMILHVPILTPVDRAAFYKESWWIQAYRNGFQNTDLQATNDAEEFFLAVVTTLPSEPPPYVTYSPPLVTIEVVFQLDPLDTGGDAMTITAPPGFTFLENCLAVEANVNLSEDIRCYALRVPDGYKARARLDCNALESSGAECLRNVNVTVLVTTPQYSPDESTNTWFVESVSNPTPGKTYLHGVPDVGEQLGRAELRGFEVIHMNSAVTYAAISDVAIDIGISFLSRVTLPPMSTLYIKAPSALARFTCGSATRGNVNPLTLGLILACEEGEKQWELTLTLNSSLHQGLHTLTVPAVTPKNNPPESENVFEFSLRTPVGENQEVALSVKGEPVLYGLRASVWPLRWRVKPKVETPAGFGGKFSVQVPLEVIDDVDIPVYGVLVSPPQDPHVQIHPPSSVQISSASYGSKLNVVRTYFTGTNMVLLEVTPESFAVGLFTIKFDAAYPTKVPNFNLWRVALCGKGMVQAPHAYEQLTSACIDAVNLTGRFISVTSVQDCRSQCDALDLCGGFESDGTYCHLKETCLGTAGPGGVAYRRMPGSAQTVDPTLACSLSGYQKDARGSAVITVFALAGFDLFGAVAAKAPVVAAARTSQHPAFFAVLLSLAVIGQTLCA